jgi:hypothetical protein
MNRLFLLVLAGVLCMAPGVAHAYDYPVFEWNAGEPGVYNIGADGSGDVYTYGDRYYVNGAYVTTGLSKYDAAGNLLWKKADVRSNFPYTLEVAPDGHVYVTGDCDEAGYYDACTSKYDGDGNLIWRSIYSNPNGMTVSTLGISVDGSGNVYATGQIRIGTGYCYGSYTSPLYDFLTIKYDAAGNMLWASTHDVKCIDMSYVVTTDTAGNVYATGDVGTVAYDSGGNFKWFVPALHQYGNDDIIADDTGVYVTGTGGTEKYDPAGNLLWRAQTMEGWRMTSDSLDNIYVTGYTYEGSNLNIGIAKYLPDGTELWHRDLDMTSYDVSMDLAVDDQGFLYVGGDYRVYKYPSYSYHPFAMKLDPAGTLLWYRKDPDINGYPWGMDVDVSGNVYLGGGFGSTGIIKYSQATYAAYTFDRFLPPVSNGEMKGGSKVPVKFVITNPAGDIVPGAEATLSVQHYVGGQPDGEAIEVGAFEFSLSEELYLLQWDTSGLALGEWKLSVALDDGSTNDTTVQLIP